MEKLTTCHVIASRETSSLCFAVSLQGWLRNTTHGKHPGSKPSLDPPWTSRVSCWRFSMTVCCTHHLCGLVGCHTVSQKFFLETTVVYVDLIDFNLPINKSWKKDIKKTPQPPQHLDSAIVIYPSLFYANSANYQCSSQKKMSRNLMCSFFRFFSDFQTFYALFHTLPHYKGSCWIGWHPPSQSPTWKKSRHKTYRGRWCFTEAIIFWGWNEICQKLSCTSTWYSK